MPRYILAVEGVENAEDGAGTITTLPANPDALNVVTVADDDPSQLGDAPSAWGKLWNMVKAPFHGVDATIHAGGQAVSKRHIQESLLWCTLMAYEGRLQQRCPQVTGTVLDVAPGGDWVPHKHMYLSQADPTHVRCLQQQLPAETSVTATLLDPQYP